MKVFCAKLTTGVCDLPELLEEARLLADTAVDCVVIDVTMEGPRIIGVNGSAARRTAEMARAFLSKLEGHA